MVSHFTVLRPGSGGGTNFFSPTQVHEKYGSCPLPRHNVTRTEFYFKFSIDNGIRNIILKK